MQLYLLRHGIAERQRAGQPDSGRKLTDEGREKLRRVLERAKAAKVKPTLILSSPYLRAMETARMAADVLEYTDAVVETRALVPSGSPAEVWEILRSHAGEDAVLLAGHEPLLSDLASFLLGTSRTILEMKKGALLCIELETPGSVPRGVLQWLLTQRLAGAPDAD